MGQFRQRPAKAIPADLKKGDVAFHLGYSPVDVGDVAKIVGRGLRFIYSSPCGRPATLKDHKNLTWLDLPCGPGDACVDVPGYAACILPSSSRARRWPTSPSWPKWPRRWGGSRRRDEADGLLSVLSRVAQDTERFCSAQDQVLRDATAGLRPHGPQATLRNVVNWSRPFYDCP